jgi:hypothetical protein
MEAAFGWIKKEIKELQNKKWSRRNREFLENRKELQAEVLCF